ncbi:MAG TPA: hypothetical protein VMZ53_26105 [Kofleriaceae bacterium]|nr:hypothetical protein [Kofleriaceae bacterium]
MRALAFAALLLTGVAATGCSNLPAFEQTCGNGAIDPGESCDRANDSTCQECVQTCPGHRDEECTETAGPGYRCGANDMCFAPSGLFLQESVKEIDFPVGGGQIADLDGDRIGDIVGYSDINLDVRFGVPSFNIETRSSVIVPFSNISLAVRAFPAYDDEKTGERVAARSDILLPTQDGLAGFTARAQSLVSYPFANAPGQRGVCALDPDPTTHIPRAVPVQAFSLDKHHLAFVRRRVQSGALEIAILDPANAGADQCSVQPLCSLSTDSAQPGKYVVLYDRYDLQPTATQRTSTIIAVSALAKYDVPDEMKSKTADVCVVHFADDTNVAAGSHFKFQTLLGNATIGRDAFVTLARTHKTAACPALYTSAPALGVQVFAPALTAPCTYGAPQAVPTYLTPGTFVTGRIPLVPPIPNYAPDAIAVVSETSSASGSTDIFAFQNPTGFPNATETEGKKVLSHVTRPLVHFRSADLDGDGRVEGVGAVSLPLAGVFGGQPDFDILYRTKTTDSFLTYHMATLSIPSHIELGDFDGNGLTDIAFSERLGSEDRLLVSYGTPDRPLDPIEVATFTAVGSLQRIDLPDSLDPTGEALDDLVVVDAVNPPEVNLAILHGNPQRTMLAFYDPNNNLTSPTKLVAAIAGNFVPDGDAMETIVDVSLFDDAEPNNMYVVSGILHAQGLRDPALAFKVPALTNQCPFGAPAGKVCVLGSKFRTWSLGNRDVIIAINPPIASGPTAPPLMPTRKLVTLDPMVSVPGASERSIDAQFSAATVDPDQLAIDMVAADVYGTGQRELFISMGSIPGFMGDPEKDHVAMCTVDASGVPQMCTNILASIPDPSLDAAWRCLAAQPARVHPEGRRDFVPEIKSDDLVLLCRRPATNERGPEGRVLRISRDPESPDPALRSETVLSGPGVAQFQFLAVGDVNGDRVDDLVGISFDQKTQLPKLHIYPQCHAEDLKCHEAAITHGAALGAEDRGAMP